MKHKTLNHYSDRYVTRIGRVTSRLFKRAVIDVLKLKRTDNQTLAEMINEVRMAKNYGQQRDTEITPEHAKLIDEKYLELILKLPSKDLNHIINCHKSAQIRRADRTIETIMSELASRELLNDSSESDLNERYGDIDESTKKS